MDRFCNQKAVVIYLLLIIFSTQVHSKDVSVISWWGYLLPEHIQPIEEMCQAKIHVDEYYSNPEFLRRVGKIDYDIAIYSNTVYPIFIDTVKTHSAEIQSGLVDHYNEKIKKHFYDSKYPSDTVFFLFSLTGFYWNKNNISLQPTDSIEDIFNKAKGKTVVMLDEHVEVMNLLSKVSDFKNVDTSDQSIQRITELLKNKSIYITSSLGNIYKKDDFAFAYTWSGEVLKMLESQDSNYNFIVHPKLSHSSKDLLTAISGSKESTCVAKHLAGINHIEKLAKATSYFSPYIKLQKQTKSADALSNQFINLFETLPHLKDLSIEEYDNLDIEWQTIKMSLIKSK